MQNHIFRNMDGMTYSQFLDVFKEMLRKEGVFFNGELCLYSYRFVIGEHVYYRMRDAMLKHFVLDEAERIIESGRIAGIDYKISEKIHPNTVKLEKCINKFYSSDKEVVMNYRIKDVIFSGPCTIVLWKDGTKTIVRCENEFFDREKGLAMAICKKVLGTNKSGSNYYDVFKKWCSEEEDIPETLEVVFTIEQVANKTGLSKTTINRRCLYKDYPNAKKINNVWWIPEADFQKDIKEGK